MNAPTTTLETRPEARPDAPPESEAPRRRPAPARIGFGRLVAVETRKTFDTRAGLWLLIGVAVTALVATASVVAFAPDALLTYDTFGTAIGVPLAVLLPIIAILSVTSEWSQRTGLTTFTLVPGRDRVIAAKLVVAVAVGLVATPVALAIGALGNVVGTAIAGVPTVWDVSWGQVGGLVTAYVLTLLIGFMLGVLLRSSAGAIVGYFVYAFVLPTIFGVLAATQAWFAERQAWLDFNFATGPLYDGTMTGEAWAQLAASGAGWLLLPLAVGLVLVRRTEVK